MLRGRRPGQEQEQGQARVSTGQPSGNLWSFLCPTQAQLDECRTKFCNSACGKIVNGITTPVVAFSGGLFTPLCPPDAISNAALAASADSVDGAAARIKKDEADAKARRANVRYLGTVNCRRYPEAEKALINALRTDHNECVRLEAAMALGSGCCCTKRTIEALALSASGSDKDGNPPEESPRVRHMANASLLHCLEHGTFPASEGPAEKPPESPEPKVAEEPRPVDRPALNFLQARYLQDNAQRIAPRPVAPTPAPAKTVAAPEAPAARPGKGLFDIISRAYAQSHPSQDQLPQPPAP